MKKTQKNLLGLFGLSLVLAVTVFAACLPGPGASAAGSVTDTVTIRVVGDTPKVDVTGIESGDTFTNGEKDITISYEVVDKLTIEMAHTDKDGISHSDINLESYHDYEPGSQVLALNLIEYGYGEYTITVTGEGPNGIYDEDIIDFTYIPVAGTATPDETTGDPVVDLDFVPGDGTHPNGVETIIINVYDEDGNPIEELSGIEVNKDTHEITLPFGENGLPDGNYTIELIALNANGDELYKPYIINFEYTGNGEEPVVPDSGGTDVPDTGELFGGLNISKSDYLVTGLLIFFTAGIGGAIFIVKRNQKSSKRR